METTADTADRSDSSAIIADILDTVAGMGHDVDKISADVLASIDHLHFFGVHGTLRLAAAAGIAADDVVLDVACGIGGPARTLATHFGCQVVGVAVNQDLGEVATELNRRTGLDDLIEIRSGDATALPCDDSEFTVAWTQRASMKVAHKKQMLAEKRRALVTGGRLAFFDVLAGPQQPLHYPVPWADDEGDSTLATPEEERRMLTESGFAIRTWDDVSASAADYVTALARGTGDTARPLAPADLAHRAALLAQNAAEGRVMLVQIVADAV